LLTSIIILAYNKLEYTRACIESIRRYTTTSSYELIVIDNGSTDGTSEWLASQSDIHAIYNHDNLGFPAGCNQGIRVANGENILLLNNDTIVTEKWLELLEASLYSSSDIGAVGPVSNSCSYYQTIPVNYSSITEMQEFASNYNSESPDLWEQRIRLIGFCMLLKRAVVDAVGFLDERFFPGNFEDDDYSFRIVKAGYRLILCRNVFVHHFQSTSFTENHAGFVDVVYTNREKFRAKWGFDSWYSTNIRLDVIQLMNEHVSNASLCILEVGCACGATMLKIKDRYKNAELHGIELNESSASVAASFVEMSAMNVEVVVGYPDSYFDYIILADVLEHLYDPWVAIRNLRRCLKEDGFMLLSIPNVMHISNLRNVVQGRWTYEDAGILDRTHIRFFTLKEIDDMLQNGDFSKREYAATGVPLTEQDEQWVDIFRKLSGMSTGEQFKAYQYLVKAAK